MIKKILIADSSDESRKSVAGILTDAGFGVIESEDGERALEIIKEENISLVLSEVNIPGLDGILLLKTITKDYRSKMISVIMLTAETDDDLVTEARLNGAKAWILKPVKAESLIDAVKKYTAP